MDRIGSMRLLRWIAALGISLAVIGFLAFRESEPGITELPVTAAAHDRVKLKPFPEGTPWKPGPGGENPLVRGEIFWTNPPPPPRTQLTTAALENGIGISADHGAPPARVHWLANDQVLIRWGPSLHLINTASGAVTPVEGYDDAPAASPDGTWVVYSANQWAFGWMVNVRTGERFTFPNPPAVVRWLTPDLATYGHDQEDGFGFLDMATGTHSWLGARMLRAVFLKTGEICYATGYGEYVICHASPAAEPLTLTSYRSGIAEAAGVPVPDPAGTRIAYVDRLGTKPRQAVGFAGTAHATKPMMPNPWVDTLLVYNAETGLVKRYPLPGGVQVQELLWSADGARIGIRIREMANPQGLLRPGAEYLVMDVATGAWTSYGWLAEADLTLERVLPDRLLIRRGAELLDLLPNQAPRPWQPGKQAVAQLLPDTDPVSGIGRDWLLVSGQALELHTATGDVCAWRLGDATVAKASASPDRRWAAVLTTDNRLLLLRRD